MDAFLGYLLAATFGLPAFGAVLLFVAAMISVAIFLRRKRGAAHDIRYPKTLTLIGLGMVIVPTLYFVVAIMPVLFGRTS